MAKLIHVWTNWSRGLVSNNSTMTRWGPCPGCHAFSFVELSDATVMLENDVMGTVALRMSEHSKHCLEYAGFVQGFYRGQKVRGYS